MDPVPSPKRRSNPRIAGQMSEAEREGLDGICRTDEGDSVVAKLGARLPSADAIKAECQRLGVVREATPSRLELELVLALSPRQSLVDDRAD